MKLNGAKVETEGCDEIACNDTCTLTVDLTRTHAKTFTDKKVEVCEKQVRCSRVTPVVRNV